MNHAEIKHLSDLTEQFGAPSTAGAMWLLYSQCKAYLTDDQLRYLNSSEQDVLHTMHNLEDALVGLAGTVDGKKNNLLSDPATATSVLYTVTNALAGMRATLEVAQNAGFEISQRQQE